MNFYKKKINYICLLLITVSLSACISAKNEITGEKINSEKSNKVANNLNNKISPDIQKILSAGSLNPNDPATIGQPYNKENLQTAYNKDESQQTNQDIKPTEVKNNEKTTTTEIINNENVKVIKTVTVVEAKKEDPKSYILPSIDPNNKGVPEINENFLKNTSEIAKYENETPNNSKNNKNKVKPNPKPKPKPKLQNNEIERF